MSKIKQVLSILVFLLLFSPIYASQGKYAVLIFGGYGGTGKSFDASYMFVKRLLMFLKH